MNYIIVDSVKGGCGKSSVALRTAIELAQSEKNNVLVIDMDIMGSSLKTFVTGELLDNQLNSLETCKSVSETELNIGEKRNIEKDSYWLLTDSQLSSNSPKYFFTDLFYKLYEKYKSKPIESPFLVCPNEDGKKRIIHIAFSSQDQTVKNRFRLQKSNNFQTHINVRYYEEILRKYIKLLNEKLLSNGKKATHIIFDMPPNSDQYSDCVFSILLEQNKKASNEKKDSVELRVVSSCDLAHIGANIQWMKDLYQKNGVENAFPEKLSFVINDITQASKLDGASNVKAATIKKAQEALKWTEFENTNRNILWRDPDDTLVLSSACKSCVAFNRIYFEEFSIESNNTAPDHKDSIKKSDPEPKQAEDETIGNDYESKTQSS